MADQLSRPGPNNNAVGKATNGSQVQGSEVDVKIYADVKTSGPETVISTEFGCPIGKVPTGAKTGGL